jgi:hypothetical protein
MTLLTSCAMLKVVASGYGCNEYITTPFVQALLVSRAIETSERIQT